MYVTNVKVLVPGRRMMRKRGSLVVTRGSRVARAGWNDNLRSCGCEMGGSGSSLSKDNLIGSAKAEGSDVKESKTDMTAGGRAGVVRSSFRYGIHGDCTHRIIGL